ncbi:MAG: OmpA family protein [Bacteroidetes bacterium]|nr:OmpA family protein [Bacteroidota bacterium]
MKQKLTILLAAVLTCSGAMAQDNWASAKKGTVVGIHFNLADFNAPTGIKNPMTGKVYSSIRDMSKGMSFSYWKGLTNKIDYSVKLNAMFHDYRLEKVGLSDKTEIGLELEPTINIRPVKDDAKLAPFLTTGAGLGYYTGKFGAYVPAGVGLQLNWSGLTYMFLQAQYKFTLTKDVLDDHLFYSIGFAENIGKKKLVVKTPPPPPPVVEAPKDRDGDGIVDADDKCPDVPGLASLQGCPDKDGDGITDAEDKCPDVPGLAKYGGCPIPDTDKDGINDEQDKCPTVPGVARYQGCPIPDTDKDGVNDEEDKCPNEAGPASNFGCPVIAQAVIERVNLAAKNIFFATGSSKLLPKSFKSLNDVVKIMNDDKTLKLSIDGYTDNTGSADKNQTLSENRAAAVKTYLVSKGVDESKISSAGHGSENPAADNKTAAGRAKNRRVEMKVSNY